MPACGLTRVGIAKDGGWPVGFQQHGYGYILRPVFEPRAFLVLCGRLLGRLRAPSPAPSPLHTSLTYPTLAPILPLQAQHPFAVGAPHSLQTHADSPSLNPRPKGCSLCFSFFQAQHPPTGRVAEVPVLPQQGCHVRALRTRQKQHTSMTFVAYRSSRAVNPASSMFHRAQECAYYIEYIDCILECTECKSLRVQEKKARAPGQMDCIIVSSGYHDIYTVYICVCDTMIHLCEGRIP